MRKISQDVIDALHAKYQPRNIRFRYDLLDKNDNKKGELTTVIGGEVSLSAFAQIKRTAKFTIRDSTDINWLTDRIQPIVEVNLPKKIERKTTVHGDNKAENPFFDEGFDEQNLAFKWENWQSSTLGIAPGRIGRAQKIFYKENATYGVYQSNAPVKAGQKIYIKFTFKGDKPNYLYLMHTAGNQSLGGVVYEEIENGWQLGSVETTVNNDGDAGLLFAYDSRDGTERKGTLSEVYFSTTPFEKEFPTVTPSRFIEFPLGVFLLSSPTRADQNSEVYRDVEAYDKLIILRDDKFLERHTVTSGTNYIDAVVNILQSANITKWNIEQTDKTLPTDIEFEPGTDKLRAVNRLLSAINFNQLHVDVNGYFVSMPYRNPQIRSAEYTYKDDDLSVTYNGMEEELDIFNVPNSWVAVLSDPEREPLVSSYTNDNPDSPTSTVNRGRTIVDYREVENIADQTALDNYVNRIAFHASQVYGKIEFETAIMPQHDYMDVLEIDYSPLNIKGKYSETGWTIPLTAGAKMKHSVRGVINI